jgi:hypothetical protein
MEWRRVDWAFARVRAREQHGVRQQSLHEHHDQSHGGEPAGELQQHQSLQQRAPQSELRQFETE